MVAVQTETQEIIASGRLNRDARFWDRFVSFREQMNEQMIKRRNRVWKLRLPLF